MDPETTPRLLSDLLGGLTGLSIWSYQQLRFTVVKGYKAKSAKGEGTWGEVQRKSGASSQESSSREITRGYLIPPAMSHHTCEGLYIGETRYRLSTQNFTGTCSHLHRLLSMYQYSRLSEGKLIFCLNHIVCTI